MERTYKGTLVVDVLALAADRVGPTRLRTGTEGWTDGESIHTPGQCDMMEFHVLDHIGRTYGRQSIYFVPKLCVRILEEDEEEASA